MTGQALPHDLAAERAVLGRMLVRPDAIPDICGLIGAEDFYLPMHATVFLTLVDGWTHGEPLDSVALAVAMGDAADPAWIAQILRDAPAGHARLVRELQGRRIRRGILTAAAEATTAARNMMLDPTQALEEAQAALNAVDVPVEDVRDLWMLDDFIDRDAASEPWVIPGLFRTGWRAVIVSGEGRGKLTAVSTPVLTSAGWTTIGRINPGAEVYGPDGKATLVVACSEVTTEPTWRITFDDGASIVAGERHLWETVDYAGRQPSKIDGSARWEPAVRTTAEIARTLHARGGHTVNHAIACAQPPDLPHADLPIGPWTLGYWLGNGTALSGQITSGGAGDDQDVEHVLSRLINEGVPIGAVQVDPEHHRASIGCLGLMARLRDLGVRSNKHIPDAYLLGSVDQRLALFQGLMDSDGYVNAVAGKGRGKGSARCELSFCDKPLAEGALRLAWSLGIKATVHESDAKLYGRVTGTRYRIQFQTTLPVFSLPRKADALASVPLRTRRAVTRYIVGAVRVPDVPLRCIEVARSDGMWLAGERLIATHNSYLSRQVAVAAAAGVHPLFGSKIPPIRTLIVDLENPVDSLVRAGKLMRRQAQQSGDWDPDRCFVWHRPAGIDIRKRSDRAQLEGVVARCRPQFVALGPLYKAYTTRAREQDEQAAGEAQQVLDDLRTRYGFALLLEHHAPKPQGGHREILPYGSSLWLRWPEMGFKLTPTDGRGESTLDVGKWREPRMPHAWPNRITRGQGWPWVGEWDRPYAEAMADVVSPPTLTGF